MPARARVMNADMGASFTGSKTIMPSQGGQSVGYTFKWPATGTPNGTITFETCDNVDSNSPADEIWAPFGPTVTVSGTADSVSVTIEIQPHQAIRPKWNRTSGGSGATLTGDVNVGKA